MKHFISLILGITFLLFLNACGGGSSNNGDIPPAENIAPIANAGVDKYVFTTATVTLDGSESSDEHSDTLTYSWVIREKPTGSTASLSNVTNVSPTFIADRNGSYEIQLIVNDGSLDSIADTVTITAATFSDVKAHDSFFESTRFSGSQNCAECHNNQEDTITQEDVSIVNAWQGTMMANAAIDPLYLAKVASEVQRNPKYKDLIEDKCSRCHMPMANVEAGFSIDDTIAISGDGFTNPDNPHYDAAKEGVSCTLCHQIQNSDKLGTEAGFSGEFVIDENTSKPNRKIYGQFDDIKKGSLDRMKTSSGFEPNYGEQMNKSELCASCHNLNTPVINADGNLSDPLVYFPEQAVYTEWEFSEFNTTESRCQDCHMPETEGSVNIATGGGVTARSPFHQHKFLGANTYMLDILKNNRDKLGVKATEERFNDSITDTRSFLKAYADVNITSKGYSDNKLKFSVLVSNHSGHKFPTSIPTRRAWLHVKVTNDEDQTVFESGAMNNKKQIIDIDDSDGYQEHHEEIDEESEVQVYEAIMVDTNGKQTYTFLNASSYVKDNRILPKGFKDNDVVPTNAQTYGEALEDSDFMDKNGNDIVNYEISLPNANYDINVTLKYQTVSYGFMQDLYKDIKLTEVALMKVLDDNANTHFEVISTDTATYTP